MTVSAQERGAALVLVLVFTTAMAAAAVAFLAGRSTDALTLRGQLQAVEAEAVLDAALQQTIAVLANRTPRQAVPDELSWAFGDIAIRVRLERESSKIDLNQATDALLRALPMALGAKEDQAAAMAAAVQDWRDDDHQRLDQGAEDSDYRSEGGHARGAADRPMANPAELLYIRGVDRDIWAALQPYVTVYSGAAAPDSRSASPIVRQAIEIARNIARDDPRSDDPTTGGEEVGSGANAEVDATTADRSASGAGLGAASGTVARNGATEARRAGRGERDRTSDGAQGAGEAGDDAADQAGEDTDAQTLLLEVRFPNGYEAAAKAVVVLGTPGTAGPPYTVLGWAPVLRQSRDGS